MEKKEALLKLSKLENSYTARTSSGELFIGEKGHRPMELLPVAFAERQQVRDMEIKASCPVEVSFEVVNEA